MTSDEEMTHGEIRMTKDVPRAKRMRRSCVRHSDFVIVSSFGFRHSSLQRLSLLLVCTVLLALSGASCPQMVQRYTNPLPRRLPPQPTLEQVVDVVNRNSLQIRSFFAGRASISGPGFPSLGASVAFERPMRFRLRAGTGLTGTEMDLGSNDDLFWFWLQRNQPPGIYYCRHSQLAAMAARQMPLEPSWLIEAMGVMGLDPALPHQGPTVLPNDRLRVDTIQNTPNGPVTKITIIDGSQGWILEQQVLNAQGQLVASSVASGHRQDPLSGLVMPTVVEVSCPSAKLSMRIDLGNVEINHWSVDPANLWAMPSYPNATPIDLADPKTWPAQPQAPVAKSAQQQLVPPNQRRARW
jgi:hypothetical protein